MVDEGVKEQEEGASGFGSNWPSVKVLGGRGWGRRTREERRAILSWKGEENRIRKSYYRWMRRGRER